MHSSRRCPYCQRSLNVAPHVLDRHIVEFHPEFADRTRYEHVLAGRAIWQAKRWEVTFAFGWVCLACGRTEAEARAAGRGGITIDHVLPWLGGHGGPDNITNWQPLCYGCNSAKSNAYVDYRPLARVVAITALYVAGRWPPACERITIGRMAWCSVHEKPWGHEKREAMIA